MGLYLAVGWILLPTVCKEIPFSCQIWMSKCSKDPAPPYLCHLLKCCHYNGDFQFEAGCLVSRLRKWHCYSLTIIALLGMPGSSMTFMYADFWDFVEQGVYTHYVYYIYCAEWPGMHFCHISDFGEIINYWYTFLSVDLQNPENCPLIIICHWHHLSWVSRGIPKPYFNYSWVNVL
jgi:hypothetical protein